MIESDDLVGIIETLVRGGKSPIEAYKDVQLMLGPNAEALIREAARKFEEKTGRIRDLRWPPTLRSREGRQDWYTGPSPDDWFWPRLRKYLIEEKGRSTDDVNSIDKASTKIVSLLAPPGLAQISTKGLVVGYVQSGKTANFTAVIAKAADVGYKFFIVLSGLTNLLRRQTQVRLEQELVNLGRERWFMPTTINEDFRPGGPAGNVNAILTDQTNLKVLCVIKKNATVLNRVIRWLSAASQPVLNSCAVLVIDDEADQASVNASRNENERTKVNRRILEILSALPKFAYIGYTATPFANFFSDTSGSDLYPSDFIVDLPKPPPTYFGTERIFGRELLPYDDPSITYEPLDVIRIIDDDEVPSLKPRSRAEIATFEPEITPSLESALRYFWMAAAARLARGQADQYSTMLVHTAENIPVHERFRPVIEAYRERFRRLLENSAPTLLNPLRQQWDQEQTRFPSTEVGEQPISFDDLRPNLSNVVNNTIVLVENSRSDLRLSYGETPRPYIVVGGNTLSRGLTLEGLIVSFFIRSASAYDTLLQMGRWFGYREGYSDLPRIWMTQELSENFYDLATVEEEIRSDIQRYDVEGLTPLQFAVRVRNHPTLEITQKLKMQRAIPASVSYNGRREQTTIFRAKDAAWLDQNMSAGRNLISQLEALGIPRRQLRNTSLVYRDVPVATVLPFFAAYSFSGSSRSLLRSDLIQGYIKDQNEKGQLQRWNIVIKGKGRDDTEDAALELAPGLTVPLLTRSKRVRLGSVEDDTADLGAIMSKGDVAIDLDLSPSEASQSSDDDLLYRRTEPSNNALLILYPIFKDSIPNRPPKPGKREWRAPLEAAQHMLGLGMVFPRTSYNTPQSYMTADLSNVEIEELDWVPEEEAAG